MENVVIFEKGKRAVVFEEANVRWTVVVPSHLFFDLAVRTTFLYFSGGLHHQTPINKQASLRQCKCKNGVTMLRNFSSFASPSMLLLVLGLGSTLKLTNLRKSLEEGVLTLIISFFTSSWRLSLASYICIGMTITM